MGLHLSKGQSINLNKNITLALFGFNWENGRYDGNIDFDIDASAFLLGKTAKYVTKLTLFSITTWSTTAVR